MRREEETQRRNARRLSVFLMIGALLIGACLIGEANAHARRVEEMKRQHAEEMAECLRDWGAGKNGGCDWEEKSVIFEGEPVLIDVEVIARPID